MKKCLDCNKTFQEEYSFCPTCGKKFVPICTACGKVLPEEAVYCPYCGKKQAEAESPAPGSRTEVPPNARKLDKHCIYARCIPMTKAEKEFFTSMCVQTTVWTQDYLVWHWTDTITGWRALDDGDTFDAGEEAKSLYVAKLTAKQKEQFRQENRGRFTGDLYDHNRIFSQFSKESASFIKKSAWDKWAPKTFSTHVIKNDPESKPFSHDYTHIALAENVIEQGDIYLIAYCKWCDEYPKLDMIGFNVEKE